MNDLSRSRGIPAATSISSVIPGGRLTVTLVALLVLLGVLLMPLLLGMIAASLTPRASYLLWLVIGSVTLPVVSASLLLGDERASAWREMLDLWPNYAKYAARTDREIPVFRLTPLP